MAKFVRLHLAGTGLAGRVVKLKQLTITEVNEVQLAANRKAANEDEDLKLALLAQIVAQYQTIEGVKKMLRGVTALPVDVLEALDDGEAPSAREVVDGRLRILRAGEDGFDNLLPSDWVELTLKDLEMPGAKNLDEAFDAKEYTLLSNAYHQLHGAPAAEVQNMLAGKLRPVAMEG